MGLLLELGQETISALGQESHVAWGKLGAGFASLAQGLLKSLDLKPGWMVFHGGDVSLDSFKITRLAGQVKESCFS
jgi:hypothetical protein